MPPLPYSTLEDRAAGERFWQGREAARPLFERVVAAAQPWGPFRVVVSHSRIALVARTRFLWCPIAHPDGRISIRFLLPRPLDSPRLRVDRLGGRWSHRVHLSGPMDVDAELLGWLHEAYDWASSAPP